MDCLDDILTLFHTYMRLHFPVHRWDGQEDGQDRWAEGHDIIYIYIHSLYSMSYIYNSFWTRTLSQERLQSLQTPRSQECLGIGAYMGLYRICCHGHRFTYPSTSTNLSRMWKQLGNDRKSYYDVYDKLVNFQEASCGILAPTAP